MKTFYYQSKGTAHDHYNSGEFEAENEDEAKAWLDKTFGIERDADGNQTNPETMEVGLINRRTHEKHQKVIQKMADEAAKAEKDEADNRAIENANAPDGPDTANS